DVPHDPLANVGVQRGERVVQEVQLAVGVHRPRETHARLLPPAQVDALLANLGLHPARQQPQVRLQLAHAHRLPQPPGVLRSKEKYILTQRRVHDPWLLRHVRNASRGPHTTARHLVLPQQCRQERRFTASSGPNDHSEFALWYLDGDAP
ncbi:hypothetical protein TraAM80_09673, partial [Trypanosoma rangeli]